MNNIREIILEALDTNSLGDERSSEFDGNSLFKIVFKSVYDQLYQDLILYADEQYYNPEIIFKVMMLSFKFNRFEVNTYSNVTYDKIEAYRTYKFKYAKTLYTKIATNDCFIKYCNSLIKKDVDEGFKMYSKASRIRDFITVMVDDVDGIHVDYLYDNLDRDFMNIEFCVINCFDSLYKKLNSTNKKILTEYCDNILFDTNRWKDTTLNSSSFPSCLYNITIFNDWKDKLLKVLKIVESNNALSKFVGHIQSHASYNCDNDPGKKDICEFCSSYYFRYMRDNSSVEEFKQYILEIHEKNKNFYCYSKDYKEFYNLMQILE